MPQDGIRSAVYRSFVKCDDPKGVANCKTMRKSKSSSKTLEVLFENQTFTSDSSPPPENRGKGKKIDSKTIPKQEAVRPSFLHLKEVPKGAQKLNQVIDTYSYGMRFDQYSKEIAKDLLKGALDLQESLMVLGKLQEASHYMAKFRKKPTEKTKDDRNEEQTWIRRSKSDRYADYNYQTGFQKPSFYLDGSSRDCYDELRTVIRDSLARQNLLPPNFREKPNISKGKTLDSMGDIPSTSSTQSSTMNFISYTSSDTSFSSDSTKTSKGSNLIAKLMGLEEVPSQQVYISSPKRFEIEKFPGHRRATSEINMAKLKKPQSAYKEDMEGKKLRDIVETMQYEGLLKGNSSEGSWGQSNYSDSNNNKKVEEVVDTLRYKPFKGNSSKGSTAQSNYSDNIDIKKVLITDGTPIVIMKPTNASRAEPEEHEFQTLARKTGMKDMNRGAVDFNEVCRRLRGEVTPKRNQDFREFPEKELSIKLKASGSVDRKEKKKRVERMDKTNDTKKKLGEMENFNYKTASMSHDQDKVYSAKERKTETEPIRRRRSVSLQKTTPPMVVLKNKPPLSQKGSDRKKNQKADKELLADPLVDEDIEHKHSESLMDQSFEGEFDKARTSSTTAAQLLVKEETDAHVDQIKDQHENTKFDSMAESDEEASCLNSSNSTTEDRCLEKQTKEKKLFYSSPSFLTYAKELFNIETGFQSIQLQPTSLNDSAIADTRLLLDIANELMLRKKLSTQALHPSFPAPPKSLKITPSLSNLVDEVCKGISELSKYSDNGNAKLIVESLYSVLERDMLGTGLANGAWELGWRHVYSSVEVEKVVGDIEYQIFNELMEGMVTGFPRN